MRRKPATSATARGTTSSTPRAEAAAGAQKPESRQSDFGAGIFDAEPESPAKPATGADSGAAMPAKKMRKRRTRKSRTQRLAEEAAVIAAVSRPASAGHAATEKSADEQPPAGRASATRKRRTRRSRSRGASKTEEPRKASPVVAGGDASPEGGPGKDDQPDMEVAPLDFDALDAEERDDEIPAVKSAAKEPERPRAGPAAKFDSSSQAVAAAPREMLINAAEPEECRIALLSGGRLDELYIERAAAASNVGNIYKGIVTKVEPSIQAAFIDFGLPAQGFLHISDLHPRFFPDSKGEAEIVGMKMPRRHRPPIQNCLKRGDKVIVQVIKEGIGTKGPTLSSYISIPGRFLVMMPGMEQLGVSRKIEDEEQRRKMREALSQLSLPKEMGFIMRTAGADRTKRDLQRDLNFLSRLWKQVDKRIKQERAPTEIYRESDLVIRTIRDVYDSSLHRIVVDSPTVANRVRQFLAIASPRSQDIVEVYEGPEPLFHRYGIEAEIDRLHLKTVPLPCGGSLVIEQTEALVAIDVNSGRFRIPDNAEETAYRVNLEAADEIARQLRLRDLGGLIICDLIDMGQDRHRRTIERRISEALRKHKERAKVLRISKFGLMEMTRQRQRQSFNHSVFQECPRCGGSGRVKAPESVALEVMRRIRLASQSEGVARIDVRVSNSVAGDLLNRKRLQLADLERRSGQTIRIQAVEGFAVNQVVISCSDRLGREVHQASHSSVARQGPEARSTHSRSRQTGGKSRGR
jgi:ribonuclease E